MCDDDHEQSYEEFSEACDKIDTETRYDLVTTWLLILAAILIGVTH